MGYAWGREGHLDLLFTKIEIFGRIVIYLANKFILNRPSREVAGDIAIRLNQTASKSVDK